MFTVNTSPSLSLPSVGRVHKDLLDYYRALSGADRLIFKKCYRYLFNYLYPVLMDDNAGMVISFAADFVARKHDFPLPLLCALSLLWTLSGGGADYVNTFELRLGSVEYYRMKQLKKRGLISRHYHNPLVPYGIRLNNPSWVGLTPAGISFYQMCLDDYRKELINFYGREWFGRNK